MKQLLDWSEYDMEMEMEKGCLPGQFFFIAVVICWGFLSLFLLCFWDSGVHLYIYLLILLIICEIFHHFLQLWLPNS